MSESRTSCPARIASGIVAAVAIGVHPVLGRTVRAYLSLADRLLPGRIVGFYVVGSAALGAFRPERSDIDFVAVVDGPFESSEVARLRVLHALSGVRTGAVALARRRWAMPGTCNGSFVDRATLSQPVTTITPVASHVGHEFSVGRGFDVNPVVWVELAEHGIAVRGPEPSTLGLDPEPHRLARWNRDNLEAYWRPWAEQMVGPGRGPHARNPRRWVTAWGVLGPPRLHHTIATGRVISKEAAGEYALEVFGAEWHPIIGEALAYWRGEPADPEFADAARRRRCTGAFALHVCEAAARL